MSKPSSVGMLWVDPLSRDSYHKGPFVYCWYGMAVSCPHYGTVTSVNHGSVILVEALQYAFSQKLRAPLLIKRRYIYPLRTIL